MKVWIWPLCLLGLSSAAWGQDYRIAWSPGTKQAAYLDDVKSPLASSWCAPALPLRVVSQKKFDAAALEDFLPAVGELMHKECRRLITLHWQAVDAKGQLQQKGTALSKNGWKVVADQAKTPALAPENAAPTPAVLPSPQAADTTPLSKNGWQVVADQEKTTALAPENAAPAPAALPSPETADTTPVSVFDTPDACHFRTYWGNASSAQFFPSGQKTLHCDAQKWLNGSAEALLYVSGYPLLDLPADAQQKMMSVVSANNQRLILANAAASNSWLILPFDSAVRAWRFKGKMAILGQAGTDSPSLKTLSQQWGLTGTSIPLNAVTVEKLHPEWRNPAADTLAKADSTDGK